MNDYIYAIKNKKGTIKDLWIMNAPEPKEATSIFSMRFARWVKPKTPDIETMFIRTLVEMGYQNG